MASKAKRRKRTWHDYPPLYEPDKFEEITWNLDWTDGNVEQEARVGQIYAIPERNVTVSLFNIVTHKTPSGAIILKKVSKTPELKTQVAWKETVKIEERYRTIPFGISIWEVIRPENLERLPNGKYESERWKPRILDGETWRPMSKEECNNWNEIPPEMKRVDYCLCIIPAEREDTEILNKEHGQVLDELVKAWKERKKR